MSTDLIYSIISAGIVVVYLLADGILALIGKIKAKKQKDENVTIGFIYNETEALIEEAEKFVNYSGEEKFNYVLTRLEKKYGEDESDTEYFTMIINDLVALTNKVNVSKKNKVSSTVEDGKTEA